MPVPAVPAPTGRLRGAAYVADRYTTHNAHPGDNLILELRERSLRRAGVEPGDLIVVTEGGALTDDVRCRSTCTARFIASGPRRAHVEGHVEFTPKPFR